MIEAGGKRSRVRSRAASSRVVSARKKSPKKKPAKKRAAKKPISKKKKTGAKKKPAARKPGGTKRRVRRDNPRKATVSSSNIEATRLAEAVREAEEAVESAASRLTDARERAARAALTARDKRTAAAHAVADRAREAVAVINACRLEVSTRLRESRDAIRESHFPDVDCGAHERALKDALDRYEQSLKAYDRRLSQRAEGRHKS